MKEIVVLIVAVIWALIVGYKFCGYGRTSSCEKNLPRTEHCVLVAVPESELIPQAAREGGK